MAQFYAQIKGQAGAATRLGSKRSGIMAQVSGWSLGARVEMINGAEDEDILAIAINAGSGHYRPTHHILTLTDDEEIESVSQSEPGLTNGEREITIRIHRKGGK